MIQVGRGSILGIISILALALFGMLSESSASSNQEGEEPITSDFLSPVLHNTMRDAYLLHVRYLRKKGKPEKALEKIEEALREYPFDQYYKEDIGFFRKASEYKFHLLMEMKRYDDATKCARTTHNLFRDVKVPEPPWNLPANEFNDLRLHISLAQVYEAKKEYQRSLEHYKNSYIIGDQKIKAKRVPKDEAHSGKLRKNIYLALPIKIGTIYEKSGKYDLGVAEYRKALDFAKVESNFDYGDTEKAKTRRQRDRLNYLSQLEKLIEECEAKKATAGLETGSISGVISPPLPDLFVQATAFDEDERFSRMAKVDENSGEYIIKDLRPDTYSLSFFSRGAFVLVGINLEVALSDLNDEVNAQISEVVDSFDRFFETGDLENLNNLFAEEASKDKSRIIDTVHNTESRRISNKKIVVQKGDSSKIAIIRHVCLELKGQMNVKDIIDEEIHLKSIEGQWKITKMRTTAYYGPEGREPEPLVRPYIGYILDPNMAKIDVTTGEEEKGHNYTLPPEAVRMSELKFIKLNELKISLVTVPGADTYSRACRDYLKHIGLACSIYANDYNGFFPPNFEALREGGYILKESFPKLMKCPAQQREHFETLQEKEEFETLREKYPVQEEDVGYVYIGAGKHRETEELAAVTIIAYDKIPAHDNGRNVLFMKGHVEWMPEEDFQKRLAEQKEK